MLFNRDRGPIVSGRQPSPRLLPTAGVPARLNPLSVASNEPVNGTGDGDTAPDWQVVDSHRVRLRAERAGSGNGRTYTVTITCTDTAGASSTREVKVQVPRGNTKDKGRSQDQ